MSPQTAENTGLPGGNGSENKNYARIAPRGIGVRSEPESGQKTIRFAEGYELDMAAYELRRAGDVLKLERIPMEILLFLIEQRERLVTREEIADRL